MVDGGWCVIMVVVFICLRSDVALTASWAVGLSLLALRSYGFVIVCELCYCCLLCVWLVNSVVLIGVGMLVF